MTTKTTPGGELRRAARRILYAVGEELPTVEHARAMHAEACRVRDAEAIALWARVIWRTLAAERAYDWLRQPVGPRVGSLEWSRRQRLVDPPSCRAVAARIRGACPVPDCHG